MSLGLGTFPVSCGSLLLMAVTRRTSGSHGEKYFLCEKTFQMLTFTIVGKIQLQTSERGGEDRQRVPPDLPRTRRAPCPPHGGGDGRGQVGDGEAHEVYQSQVLL